MDISGKWTFCQPVLAQQQDCKLRSEQLSLLLYLCNTPGQDGCNLLQKFSGFALFPWVSDQFPWLGVLWEAWSWGSVVSIPLRTLGSPSCQSVVAVTFTQPQWQRCAQQVRLGDTERRKTYLKSQLCAQAALQGVYRLWICLGIVQLLVLCAAFPMIDLLLINPRISV